MTTIDTKELTKHYEAADHAQSFIVLVKRLGQPTVNSRHRSVKPALAFAKKLGRSALIMVQPFSMKGGARIGDMFRWDFDNPPTLDGYDFIYCKGEVVAWEPSEDEQDETDFVYDSYYDNE